MTRFDRRFTACILTSWALALFAWWTYDQAGDE